MVTTLRTRLSRAGARWQRCFSLRSGARSVVCLAGRSQARGVPSSRCPGVRGHTWSRSAQPCQRIPLQSTWARPTAVSRFKAAAQHSPHTTNCSARLRSAAPGSQTMNKARLSRKTASENWNFLGLSQTPTPCSVRLSSATSSGVSRLSANMPTPVQNSGGAAAHMRRTRFASWFSGPGTFAMVELWMESSCRGSAAKSPLRRIRRDSNKPQNNSSPIGPNRKVISRQPMAEMRTAQPKAGPFARVSTCQRPTQRSNAR